jgi:hypothetical protein
LNHVEMTVERRDMQRRATLVVLTRGIDIAAAAPPRPEQQLYDLRVPLAAGKRERCAA